MPARNWNQTDSGASSFGAGNPNWAKEGVTAIRRNRIAAEMLLLAIQTLLELRQEVVAEVVDVHVGRFLPGRMVAEGEQAQAQRVKRQHFVRV